MSCGQLVSTSPPVRSCVRASMNGTSDNTCMLYERTRKISTSLYSICAEHTPYAQGWGDRDGASTECRAWECVSVASPSVQCACKFGGEHASVPQDCSTPVARLSTMYVRVCVGLCVEGWGRATKSVRGKGRGVQLWGWGSHHEVVRSPVSFASCLVATGQPKPPTFSPNSEPWPKASPQPARCPARKPLVPFSGAPEQADANKVMSNR
jgi:hypothetical protein